MLLVGAMPTGDYVGGAELNAHGVRISSDMTFAVTPQPARYVRVGGRTDASQWMTTYTLAQKALWDQPVVTITTGGGGTAEHPAYGSGAPLPPPTTSSDWRRWRRRRNRHLHEHRARRGLGVYRQQQLGAA